MKKKQKISDLFYDNRFLFIFSLIVAVGFWLVASVEFSTEITKTISNIPVQIDYGIIEENFGLEAFGQTKFSVDVSVSGKKYVVDSDDIRNDIVVKASTSVSTPGTQKLKLEVTTKSERPAYEIVGLFENNVPVSEFEVYFDYPKTKEFLIEPDITISDKAIVDGYHLGDFIFQEANKVSVSGPESQVNSIEKIVAAAVVDDALTENTTVNAILTAVTKNGLSINYTKFDRQSDYIQITLPVYKISTLTAECGFVNIPTDYINNFPFEVSVEPSTAKFGIPEKKLEGISGIEVTSIDFSELHSGVNTFTVYAADIPGVVVLDGTETFTVTVNASNIETANITVSDNVTFNNIPEGKTAELVSLSLTDITVCGPKNSVEKITSDSVMLVADLKNIDDSEQGEVTVPVSFSTNDCWSYGSYYAKVKIS